MKALIVDDDEDVRGLMRAILEGKGHTVVGEAGDGKAALAAFSELRPDVVFLDIVMPGMSGVEALAEIRALDPEAQVVMVTAVEQDSMNRRLLLSGAAGIIYKPFSQKDFDISFHGLKPITPTDAHKSGALTRLAAGGLSKCMLRTSDATSWTWELRGVDVVSGGQADIARMAAFGLKPVSVQVNVRDGADFASALVFRSEDMSFISGCFTGGELYRVADRREMEEGLLLEIGNIILNSLASPLINALGRGAIPSVPMLIKGGAPAVAASLCAGMPGMRAFRIISAALGMMREGRTARAGVLAALPERLAAEIAGK